MSSKLKSFLGFLICLYGLYLISKSYNFPTRIAGVCFYGTGFLLREISLKEEITQKLKDKGLTL